MTDYRALCAELFKACETLYKQSVTASHHQAITLSNGEHPIPISSDMLAQDAVFGDLLHRTRAALTEQQGEGLSDIPPGPFSEHELREQWNQQADEFNQWDSLDSCEQLAWAQARVIQRDRNARPTPPAELLADLISRSQILDPEMAEVLTPEARWDLYAGSRSQPPTEGEVAELVAALQADAECVAAEQPDLMQLTDKQLTRAAELLQQQHPTPVPVSERLPGPGEMDGSLVWCGSQAAGLPYWEWCLDDIRHPGSSGYTHWLPANTPALPTALPLPQGEVE